jgi:hypothetical protein
MAAFRAEFGRRRNSGAAIRTNKLKRRSALFAELRSRAVFVLAIRANHQNFQENVKENVKENFKDDFREKIPLAKVASAVTGNKPVFRRYFALHSSGEGPLGADCGHRLRPGVRPWLVSCDT